MRVLRVGTFPTNVFPGAGYHGYKLSDLDFFDTLYVSPKIDGVPYSLKRDKLVCLKNFLHKRTKNESILWHKIKRIIGAFFFNLKIVWLLVTSRSDLLHVHSPAYLPAGVIAKLMGRKVFISFHGSDFNVIKNSALYKFFGGLVIDHVFFLGSHMSDTLRTIHCSKVTEVINGVDRSVFLNSGLKRKKQIIAVGALKKEKGFDLLLDAIHKVRDRLIKEGYSVVIVGEGEERLCLSRKIKELSLDNYVELVGAKKRPELVNLYNQSEVFVLSSVSEGFPKVLLEALSCGCQIIATNVGSVSKVVGDDYLYLCRPDSGELASVFEGYLTHEPVNNNDTETEKILSGYDWEAVREIYREVYKRCLS